MPNGVAIRNAASLSRQSSASHSMTPASRCNGAGSVGQTSRERCPVAIDHGDGQLRLHAHVIEDAHLAEKVERRGVAPEQHVLAVVHDLAGFAIGKRGRAAAEPRSRFEHEHAGAVLRHPHGRAQSRKAGADDDRVVRMCHHDQRFTSFPAIPTVTA